MEKHQEHVEQVSTSNQELGPKINESLTQFFKDLFKPFEKEKEKSEQKVEIQRDGKTIASGVMRDGELQDVKGKIPAHELSKLKDAIGSDRGAQIGGENSKEFKILVNDKPQLHTHRGIVLKNDLPKKMRDQFHTPEPTAEKDQTTAANAPEKPKTAAASASAPTAEKAELHPAQSHNVDLRAELKKAGVDDRTIADVERQMGQSKCKSPVIVVQQTLPKESSLHRIMFAIRQAAAKYGDMFKGGTERSLNLDLRNLEVTQEAKKSLAQLSDRPPGQRSWSGQTYQLTEGKNGEFSVEAKDRGKILEFSKGRIEGSATEADLKNFKKLNQELTKYHSNEKSQQPQLAAGSER
jgi:hypothetical protein